MSAYATDRPARPAAALASEGLSAPARARLELLRGQAALCRVAAHLDLFQACSLLTLDRRKAPIVFARALLRTLGQALGQRPVIHRKGATEISFDEAWLLRLIDRLEAGDSDSVAFLLARRIPQRYRRSVAFLIHGLVARPDRAPGSTARPDRALGSTAPPDRAPTSPARPD